jgi:hypothetical protein
MEEHVQNDIRRLLKTFGVKADQAIQTYLENHPDLTSLRVRLVLEDLSAYDEQPAETLHVAVEGDIRRSH